MQGAGWDLQPSSAFVPRLQVCGKRDSWEQSSKTAAAAAAGVGGAANSVGGQVNHRHDQTGGELGTDTCLTNCMFEMLDVLWLMKW